MPASCQNSAQESPLHGSPQQEAGQPCDPQLWHGDFSPLPSPTQQEHRRTPQTSLPLFSHKQERHKDSGEKSWVFLSILCAEAGQPLSGLGYCQSLHAPSCLGSPPGTAEEPPLSVLIFGDHFSEVRAIPLDIPSTGACTSAPEPTAGLAAGTGCFPASPALLGPSSCGKAPLGKAALPCEERKKCQADRDNPRPGVLWERQGWVPTFRATRTHHLSPPRLVQPNQATAPCLTTQEQLQFCTAPCPHGGCREPPTLPLTWARGLQTCCHGKGIQHQLHDPAQAWGDAGCSSIHRSGSTTSRPFFP